MMTRPPATLVTVVGTRPQFIKVAAVWRAFERRPDKRGLRHLLVHTGQHYDDGMSGVFFRDLELPDPDFLLEVGSGTQGEQTGLMLAGVERVLIDERPAGVIVYGDTNSTLAGALAAAKLHVPVAHVEAGLRSFNRAMPEEVNRVVVDHVSSLLFCPTRTAVEHLARENITAGVHLVGDVMHESAIRLAEDIAGGPDVLCRYGIKPGAYALATVHRAENTNDPRRLEAIVRALAVIGGTCPVVWPLHPRTRRAASEAGLLAAPIPGMTLTDPLPYREMLRLERQAWVILTDSGGVQREAHWFGVPCVTLRDETEWTETLEIGANVLAGADGSAIVAAFGSAARHGVSARAATEPPEPAADRIAAILMGLLA